MAYDIVIGMQRHRFYAPHSNFTESSVTLDAEESHHLTRALRLSEGARVFVFDGLGNEWECAVAGAGKHEVELNLLRKLEDEVESPLDLTLAQALVKGDKFDWIVQKTTELGVTRIVPLITDHCDIRLAEERAENKLLRWRRISLEALKQSGRRRLVEISNPINFQEFCETEKSGLFFSEYGGRSLGEIAASISEVRRINLWVASEGGWSEAEKRKAEDHGLRSVTLGSRTLRTETAAIVVVTLAQHLLGDLR